MSWQRQAQAAMGKPGRKAIPPLKTSVSAALIREKGPSGRRSSLYKGLNVIEIMKLKYEDITNDKTEEMNKNQVRNMVPKTMNLNSTDNDKSWKNF